MIFKNKEPKMPREYAVIKFKEGLGRKGICMGGIFAKEIFVIRDEIIVDILPCSNAFIEYLEKDYEIPVVDATKGRMFPKECEEAPEIKLDLGKIFIKGIPAYKR